MAYLNLMILSSRYIFIGLAAIFIIVAFSFMKPFISYHIGETSRKYTVLYLCIVFFHIGTTLILIGKEENLLIKQEITTNSFTLLIAMSGVRWFLLLLKKQKEVVVWYIVLFLVDVGYIMLQRLDATVAKKQVGWIIFGLVIGIGVMQFSKILLRPRLERIYLAATLVLIILPFLFGETVYGAKNWVQIGPIGFQPSEIAKIPFVLYLASIFSRYQKSGKKHQERLKMIATVCGVAGLVILILAIQRDLGAALIYFIVFILLLIIGTREWLVALAATFGGGLAAFASYFMFPHVRVRVQAFIDPWSDIENTGYQVVQGLFAMGTWGFWGSGLTRGVPEEIPIVTKDYIFPALSEELGTGFGMLVILCYLGIALQGLKSALEQRDTFAKIALMGVVTMISVQVFIILGGVLKLMPLTGVTLPFISYGGSSIITSFGMIGILGYYLLTTPKKIPLKQGELKRINGNELELRKSSTKQKEPKKIGTKQSNTKKTNTKKTSVKQADLKRTEAKRNSTKQISKKKSDEKKSGTRQTSLKKTEPKKNTTKQATLRKVEPKKTRTNQGALKKTETKKITPQKVSAKKVSAKKMNKEGVRERK